MEGGVGRDNSVEELGEEGEVEERGARGGVGGVGLEALDDVGLEMVGDVGLEVIEHEEFVILAGFEGGDDGVAAAETKHANEAHPGG